MLFRSFCGWDTHWAVCGYALEIFGIILGAEAGLYHRIQDRILLSKFYCKFIKRAENAEEAGDVC